VQNGGSLKAKETEISAAHWTACLGKDVTFLYVQSSNLKKMRETKCTAGPRVPMVVAPMEKMVKDGVVIMMAAYHDGISQSASC